MSIFRSLSGRLLLLTIGFVLLAEVLIFVPSLARHREDFLRQRLVTADVVAKAIFGSPRDMLSPELEAELLAKAGVRSIALRMDGARVPVLNGANTLPVVDVFELDKAGPLTLVTDAFICLWSSAKQMNSIKVTGSVDSAHFARGEAIEVTLGAHELHQSLVAFAKRIAALSLGISIFTAILVFLTLNRLLVRPTRKVIAAMAEFRQNPESAQIIVPEGVRTEINEAQVELAAMQTELRASLRQKTRLAALGEAVAKINHDLRNILAVAQLLADRLDSVEDPMVRRVAPKILKSLDRATSLCTQTLAFGRAEEPAPDRRRIPLDLLFEDVRDALAVEEAGPVRFVTDVEEGAFAEADSDQLLRIVMNLTRNAIEALDAQGIGGIVTLGGRRLGGGVEIVVEDDGPGLPKVALDNLFKAFKGSARQGGTGLGLAIAQELARGHGGEVTYDGDAAIGARFVIYIPDDPNAARRIA